MGHIMPTANDYYEIKVTCRSESCECDLEHDVFVDEEEFKSLTEYYREQMHRPAVRFMNVYDNENLPDWEMVNFEVEG